MTKKASRAAAAATNRRIEAASALPDSPLFAREAFDVKASRSWCRGGEIIVRRAVSSATCPATDLRHGADRSRLPLSGLPLSADQPAPYRDMRHLRRGS